MKFKKAVKYQSKLRMAICGPSGSGKTYTALCVGTKIGKTAVIDSERGSASKYADLFDFDVLELDGEFSPRTYTEAIKAAEEAGYEVLIIDSLSHAWVGEGGALDMVDQAARRSRSGNSFAAWKDVTPVQRKMVDTILNCKAHVIVTMRSKTDYIMVEERGRTVPKKIGMAPVQRDGIEYEFDVVGDMDWENNFVVSKSRCPELAGQVINKPNGDLSTALLAWLRGETPPEPTSTTKGSTPKKQKESNGATHHGGSPTAPSPSVPKNPDIVPETQSGVIVLTNLRTKEQKKFRSGTPWKEIGRDYLAHALEISNDPKFRASIQDAINFRDERAKQKEQENMPLEEVCNKLSNVRSIESAQRWCEALADRVQESDEPGMVINGIIACVFPNKHSASSIFHLAQTIKDDGMVEENNIGNLNGLILACEELMTEKTKEDK